MAVEVGRTQQMVGPSGGSVFRIKAGAAKIALIRAAQSTLALGRFTQ
jgi:hypothetical protein